MSLHSRLRALERERPSNRCPECGQSAAGFPPGCVIHVNQPGVFDRYRPAPAREQPGDRCAMCGRKVVFRIASPNAMAGTPEAGD